MKKLQALGMSAVVATAAFALLTLTASAQQPPAAAPAPAAKVPAAAPAPAAPAAAATKPAPLKNPIVACKGLNEAACKANTACTFVVPTAVNASTGKVAAPYCRKTAGVAVKKPAAAAAAAAKPMPAPAAAKAPAAAAAAPKQ